MTVKIDEPLTVWYCDVCHDPILRTKEAESNYGEPGNVPPEKTGIITWSDPPRSKHEADAEEAPERSLATDYKVVHKINCDDLKGPSWETDQLLGTEGLQLWSELLWDGNDNDPVRLAPGTTLNPTLNLMFRFQVPYYEQARRYLNTEFAQGFLAGRIVISDEVYRTIIKEGSRELQEGY